MYVSMRYQNTKMIIYVCMYVLKYENVIYIDRYVCV